jgi:RNA polymerase sigma-70 factor (ECF subfamily)
VYRSIAGMANPGAFRTWLFRTTRHRAMDFLRRQRRERELVEEITATAAEAVESEADDTAPPDDAVVEAEIARLPPLQREALLLRYRDDLSYAEIALVAGVPVGTVKTRVHHAKRALQKRFQGEHS